jgi:hypothetical protein
MRFHVRFSALETVIAPADVARGRQAVGKAVARITASGKLEAGGALAPERSGFFVLKDISDPAQLYELLGGEFVDHFNIEAHPILSYEALAEIFRKDPVEN